MLALNPEQLEPSNLFEHALDMVEHENERAKARFRLGYGYIITAFISIAFVFGIQAYACWKWGPSLVGEWKLFAQRVFLVYQAVALGCWGIYILNALNRVDGKEAETAIKRVSIPDLIKRCPRLEAVTPVSKRIPVAAESVVIHAA